MTVPSEPQTPLEQSVLMSEHCAKSTETTPLPESLAFTLSVDGSAAPAFRYAPEAGVTNESDGAVLSTLRSVTPVEVVWLPARSVTITRRS